MPVDVVGTVIDILYTCICVYGNGGTMANAGERLILAVFNYDDYIIQGHPIIQTLIGERLVAHAAPLHRRTRLFCPARFAKEFLKRLRF